ncbi:MAG: GNAT family N-acetyltransferase [Pseudomonadota bacterium]
MSTFTPVPNGHLAAVVTHLEMFERPPPREIPTVPGNLVHHPAPDPDWYRDLFLRVGGQDWLWFSRMGMTDAELTGHLHDPANWVYSLRVEGRDEGIMELDFRYPPDCELGYFGLTSAMVGTGAGRWLMEQALDLAWAEPIARFHVHTCTLDSPQALPFYVRSGFTAYRREIEVVKDPRLTGVLPREAASQQPVIE